MPNAFFRFKQFTIHQDQCAMKVGTDGVLLGAWAGKNSKPSHILDVGTGTGLIALMLAQRFPDAHITALEIEDKAAVQARQNIKESPFHHRVNIEQVDFFNWQAPHRYDLVVCNPPFYTHAHPAASLEREMARHGGSFNLATFFQHTKKVLAPGGLVAIILPTDVSKGVLSNTNDWNISRQCSVHPTPEKPAHRQITELSLLPGNVEHDTLIIEDLGRHQYHPDYVNLTREFYLKF